MSEVKHTPTPYEYSDKNWRNEPDEFSFYIVGGICEPEVDDEGEVTEASAVSVAVVPGNPTGRDVAEATAKFLVKAANCHDELLAVMEEFLRINVKHGYEFDSNEPELHKRMIDACVKARGESQ